MCNDQGSNSDGDVGAQDVYNEVDDEANDDAEDETKDDVVEDNAAEDVESGAAKDIEAKIKVNEARHKVDESNNDSVVASRP